MADHIPQWAIGRARAMLLDNDPRKSVGCAGDVAPWIEKTLARLIAEHEEPPVDPLVEALDAELTDWLPAQLQRLAVNIRHQLAKRGLKIVEAEKGKSDA